MKSPVSLNLKPYSYFELFSLAVLHTCDVIFQVSLSRSPILVRRDRGWGRMEGNGAAMPCICMAGE